ncbi:hypothetical protein [Texcoconibacillus texcoconensis]|uniref:TM2 domain-containing membrane protein YozV n=1 Tax=Texcoconibacillus texcoconensis TaxID=1095777 RepID=A0A840QM74_9BACI|nr:hypothetical protein [Texcoconibacillus texcoconensis]MBB5172468.1 TM2 domain-containing membrane protein YozV [Texcoconibacillus texcoconensis]
MESKHLVRNKSQRRTIHHSASYHNNLITYRNPWVVAWWAAALPGLGHFMLCKFIMGMILFGWEIFVNVNGGLNQAIFYSFIGEFDQARDVLDPVWAIMYVGIYIFNIWDAYRRTVEMNKLYVLAYTENSPLAPFKITALEVNYLDKKHPSMAAIFSAISPGLGYIYVDRTPSAVYTIIWWIVIVYFSGFHTAILHTMIGNFALAIQTLDPQWFFFIPSIYLFSIYDSYSYTVELNKIFEKEQSNFLKKHYQQNPSKMLTTLKEKSPIDDPLRR